MKLDGSVSGAAVVVSAVVELDVAAVELEPAAVELEPTAVELEPADAVVAAVVEPPPELEESSVVSSIELLESSPAQDASANAHIHTAANIAI